MAVTDWMKLVPDQISRWVLPSILGTDGFGAPTPARPCAATSRSTPRTSPWPSSRSSPSGATWAKRVAEAIKKYDLDPDATTEVP